MRSNLLRLDEDRILVEQLNLLLRNIVGTLITDIVLALVMLWALSNDSNATGMRVWCLAIILSKINLYLLARRHLATDIPYDRACRLVRVLVILHAVDGALWGSLAWAALHTITAMESIVVIVVLAGVVGGTVAQTSPVMPVFITFAVSLLVSAVSKMWIVHDSTYDVLGIVSILYIAVLVIQAFNSARLVRSSIELRFENTKLLGQLRVKTEIAETAQREAELANAAKSKFLAAASHDLRQPIHAQGLFLEVLSRTELTAHQRELLTSSRAASEASGELLNALLDFSRVEAGVVEPQKQPLRLQHLLHKIENELAPQADEKNIVYRSRETRFVVQSDPLLLELILRNLVSNAIRYTQRGGVLVACRRRGNEAVLEVWDTGIGIAPENQQEVFREFHQLGNPKRDRNKGLGLGLAIAQGLARALGHRLTLASIPQRGSVFRLTMPLATVALSTGPTAKPLSKTRLLKARILVIDDDEIVRAGMLHLLRNWGCECQVVEFIDDALALARAHAPDLVICDYRLSEHRTGVEAISALRSLLGNSLPALLLTGDTATELLREAQTSGIPLLHKPVSPSQLYRKLVEIMEKAG